MRLMCSSESVPKGLKGAGVHPAGLERASSAELDFSATHPPLPWQPVKSCVSASWGGVCCKFQEFFTAEPDSAGMKFLWGGSELIRGEGEKQEDKLFTPVGES